ncbi:hypothetical protein ACOMHN_004066 [Nucella lapillus]
MQGDTGATSTHLAHPHKCPECPSGFTSKIGLGQHTRHKHPNLANLKRIQAIQNDILRKRSDRGLAAAAGSTGALQREKLWSEEADTLLRQLLHTDGQGRGHLGIIRGKLDALGHSFSNRQISDRKRAKAFLKPPLVLNPPVVVKVNKAPKSKEPKSYLAQDRGSEGLNGRASERVCVGSDGPLTKRAFEILQKAEVGEDMGMDMHSLLADMSDAWQKVKLPTKV